MHWPKTKSKLWTRRRRSFPATQDLATDHTAVIWFCSIFPHYFFLAVGIPCSRLFLALSWRFFGCTFKQTKEQIKKQSPLPNILIWENCGFDLMSSRVCGDWVCLPLCRYSRCSLARADPLGAATMTHRQTAFSQSVALMSLSLPLCASWGMTEPCLCRRSFLLLEPSFPCRPSLPLLPPEDAWCR